MKITIVIPAKNEQDYIGKLLDSLVAQTRQPDEIIVINSHCTDKTGEVVMSYKKTLNISFVDEVEPEDKSKMIQPGVWHSSCARNYAPKIMKGELFYTIDADVILPANNLSEVEKTARKFDIVTMPSRMLSKKAGIRIGSRLMNVYVRIMRHTPWTIGFSCFAVKKKILDKLQFDPTLAKAEDFDFITRAHKQLGAKVGYAHNTFFSTSDRRYAGNKGEVWRGFVTELYRLTHRMRVDKKLFDYDMGGDVDNSTKEKIKR